MAARNIKYEGEKGQVDERELEQLYSGLQKYSRFLTKNNTEADDLVQETLLKAIQYYTPTDLTPALLNKIAYHHWIDTFRKRKQEVIGVTEDIPDNATGSSKADIQDTVQHLLNQLTPKQAVIFILKEAFQFQSKEIAAVLNTTEMAVKSLLHRAKKRMNREARVQVLDGYWSEAEQELLSNVLYQSLRMEDPAVLIDCISVIPSLAKATEPTCTKFSGPSRNLNCMAA